MEFEKISETEFLLTLSRRNLEVMLAKLDDPLSATKFTKIGVTGELLVFVGVEENETHYEGRTPGEMYMPSTGVTL